MTPAVFDEAAYAAKARLELAAWRGKMSKPAGVVGKAARKVQLRINRMIPEKVHAAVTAVMEQMTRAILTGSDLTTAHPLLEAGLSEREAKVSQAIASYRAAAAAEGGIAGAGGFTLALAEFPTLLATKIRLLFEIAALYGHEATRPSERLYILSIFQMAFSSADHRQEVLARMDGWDAQARPESFEGMDWRKFQQEYRDYIDLAKMAQLIPVIGAPIGAVVNYQLLDRLGEAAIGAYRMRWFAGAGPRRLG